VQQRGCFRVDPGIRVVTEGGRLWPGESRLQQTVVANRGRVAERALRDVQQIVQVEEDHSPRRSSASA
jgi:hypothetical protein